MRRHEEELVKIEQDIAFWQREIGLDEAEAAVLFYQATNAAAVRFLRTGSYAPAYNY